MSMTEHAGADAEHGNALQEFGYGDVALAPGPHEAQLEQTHSILMGMDEDSLLRPFRMTAGMPAPGNDLGGWYSAPRFLAETFGQWISALCRYYAVKNDEATRARIERLVCGFSETLAHTEKLLAANGNPLYLHDKLAVGIADLTFALGAERTAALLRRFADATQKLFDTKHARTSWDKPDTMAEDSLSAYSFADTYLTAWQRCGDARYLELAKRDLKNDFVELLSRGENALPNRHVYGHITTLCGAAKAYLVLGEAAYLRAAIDGLAFAEQQCFVTGAYGPVETFLPRKELRLQTGQLILPAIETPSDSIRQERHHFETGCGSYAHFRLTRYLLRITRDARYGDSMERVMYNAALGALPLNKFGKTFYHSNYARRAKKEYFDGYDHRYEDGWPCCSGTLCQLAADYRVSTYFRDAEGIFVNLYIPSTVHWSAGQSKVSLTQAGTYPLSNRVAFRLGMSQPTALTLRFRIPRWARGAALAVNGAPVAEMVECGTFASVHRTWRDGDEVRLTLPMHLELFAADDRHPDLVALRSGPLALFAVGDDPPRVSRDILLAARQTTPDAPEWQSQGIRFVPWWVLMKETYTTYHDVSE